MSAWADGLLRNSLQGGSAVLLVYLLFRLFPRIPGSAQVWMWRAVALKFLLGMTLPITLFTEVWKTGVMSEEGPLPIVIALCSGLGILLAAAAIGRDFIKVRRMNAHGVPVDLDLARSLATRLGIKRLPVVLLRTDIDRPMLTGAARPRVHLPSKLEGVAQEMVLAHELAHVKRQDLVWEWLFVAVESIFFFNPLVWLMRREHRMAQEQACDTLAMQSSGQPLSAYGRMLLDLTVANKTRELALTANMAGTYAALHSRILRLHLGKVRLGGLATFALAATAIAMIPTWRQEFRSGLPKAPVRRDLVTNPVAVTARPVPVSSATGVRTPKEGRP